ncbi:alpha/beta hydrolase [Pedobacter sp. SD-b]|uniref:Alpha/beta hydrolase n=1 Tax=Pedobacter segetis TaxID=2793069 RepID=A0ABS1BK23_9SPHI|nr:alpha/beta hydrolase [Pedobacter segetis]MBK0383091.1 alpha/beta hydrolase [Pedobacter segetis]
MRYKILLLILLFVDVFQAHSQFKRDTSFTTYSAFTKEKKHYPEIEIAKLPLAKNTLEKLNIPYKNLGYRKLNLDITYPKKEKKGGYPVVILLFGGGWKSGDKSMCNPQARFLADNGYVAVSVEYRLSPESKYPAAVLDVKEAIRWVRLHAKEYNIDPYHIAVLGRSAGGQLAALIGSTGGDKKYQSGQNLFLSDDVQAVVDIDGILAFHHPESLEGEAASEWLGGTYQEKPAVWDQASALNNVSSQTPPILFINSSNPRFHAGRDDMIKKLNELNIYSEVHEIPNTPHPFWLFNPWFNETNNFTLKFLDKVFKED